MPLKTKKLIFSDKKIETHKGGCVEGEIKMKVVIFLI